MKDGKRSMKKVIIAIIAVVIVLLAVNPDWGNSVLEQLGFGTSYAISETEEIS